MQCCSSRHFLATILPAISLRVRQSSGRRAEAEPIEMNPMFDADALNNEQLQIAIAVAKYYANYEAGVYKCCCPSSNSLLLLLLLHSISIAGCCCYCIGIIIIIFNFLAVSSYSSSATSDSHLLHISYRTISLSSSDEDYSFGGYYIEFRGQLQRYDAWRRH